MLIKILADGSLVLIAIASSVAGMVWIFKTRPKLRLITPYVLMAGLTSLVFGKIISFWQPIGERPFVSHGLEAGAAYINNPGFPSDHALLATVLVMATYFLTPYKKISYILFGITLVMCVARVAALVHTPLDVIGGLLSGFVGVIWYIKHKRDIALK